MPQGFSSEQVAFGRARVQPRVLVVDDVMVHRMILCRAAQKAGYVTIEAGTADEAVHKAMETELACVTLDLSLGERGGTEVLRRLSELGRSMPVIIISGLEPNLTQAAFDLGVSLGINMQPPIAKPVDLIRLREMLVRIEADWMMNQQSYGSVA